LVGLACTGLVACATPQAVPRSQPAAPTQAPEYPATDGASPGYVYAQRDPGAYQTGGNQAYSYAPPPATSRTLVTIVNRSPFVDGLQVRDAVREECGVEREVPAEIAAFAQRYYDIGWAQQSHGVRGWVLETWVTGLVAPGGGGWSGRKKVIVEGRLLLDGTLVGTFTAQRSSGGLLRGCTLLKKCAHTLGSDITEWLLHPQMYARLGELD